MEKARGGVRDWKPLPLCFAADCMSQIRERSDVRARGGTARRRVRRFARQRETNRRVICVITAESD